MVMHISRLYPPLRINASPQWSDTSPVWLARNALFCPNCLFQFLPWGVLEEKRRFSFNQHFAFLPLKCPLLLLYDTLSQSAKGFCLSLFCGRTDLLETTGNNPPGLQVAGALAISFSSTRELWFPMAVGKTVLSFRSQLSFIPSTQALERRSHKRVQEMVKPRLTLYLFLQPSDAGAQSPYASRILHSFLNPLY